jgi:predicted metal-dependent peptidase
MSARERISAIVETWFLVEPLLFAVWTAHALAANPRIRTIRVCRGRIEYNPRFIEALGRRKLEAVLTCEAMRIVLKHPYARRKDNAELAYAASNLTLQEYLETALPFPRARDVFGHEQFDQQYYEFYYYKLLELAQTAGLPPAWPAAAGTAGASAAGDTPSGRDASDPLAAYADPYTSGRQNTEDWEADELLAGSIDDKIRMAHDTGAWGTIAGRWQERILALLRPQLNYRMVLRQFRASILSIRRRLTRMKPNRRYGFLYMGSRYDFTTRLLVAVDVSGSMNTEDIARGFSLINQFFTYGVPSIDVMQFDTELKGPPVTLKRARCAHVVQGRGGTNFTPVIDFIDAQRDYDGVIVFTDGYAPVPRPPQNRRTRVLWLFNSEATYRVMHARLQAIGRAAFLKETAGYRKG